MAFTTIHVAPGLDARARRRAHAAGPRAVASRVSQAQLLRSAGFVDIDEVDVTAAYAVTAGAWLRESTANAETLAAIETPACFEERQSERRSMMAAIDDGVLRRTLISASAP